MVNYLIPELPKSGPYAVDFLFSSLAGFGIENAKIQMFDSKSKDILWEGITDKKGKSKLSIKDENTQYSALIGFDDWSGVFEDEAQFEQQNEDEFDIGDHGLQIELNNSEEY